MWLSQHCCWYNCSCIFYTMRKTGGRTDVTCLTYPTPARPISTAGWWTFSFKSGKICFTEFSIQKSNTDAAYKIPRVRRSAWNSKFLRVTVTMHWTRSGKFLDSDRSYGTGCSGGDDASSCIRPIRAIYINSIQKWWHQSSHGDNWYNVGWRSSPAGNLARCVVQLQGSRRLGGFI